MEDPDEQIIFPRPDAVPKRLNADNVAQACFACLVMGPHLFCISKRLFVPHDIHVPVTCHADRLRMLVVDDVTH